jgi:hypothetical protein
MAPSLAALDQEVRGAGTLSPADQAKAEASIKRMSSLIKRVVAARSTSGSQSESFTEYVALNLNRAFCTLQGLFGRLANSSPPAEQMERARSAAVAAQTTLREAAISTACN